MFIILKFPYFCKILELMLYKFYTHLSWDCISSFEKKISSGIKKNLNFCLMALQQGVGIHLQFFFSLGCLLCKNTPWSCKKGQKSSGGFLASYVTTLWGIHVTTLWLLIQSLDIDKQWYHCRKWQSSKMLFVYCVAEFVKKNI